MQASDNVYDPATTVSAVARRYGLHASQLFVWRQQFAAPAAREALGFVPVVVAEDAALTLRELRSSSKFQPNKDTWYDKY